MATRGIFTETFPFPFYVPPSWQRPYQFEVRDADGRLVRIIGKIIGGSMRNAINEASSIEVTIPYDDVSASALVGANEIWAWNQNEETAQYVIATREDVDRTITIRAEGYLAALANEWRTSGGMTGTVLSILTTMLSSQTAHKPVTLGTVSETIGSLTRAVTVDAPKTFLQILSEIEGTFGFYTHFYVDNARVLHWLDVSTGYTGRQFRIGKNIQSMKRTTDTATSANRIYARGGRVNGSILTLAAPGYVEAGWVGYKYRKMITIDHKQIDAMGETNYSLAFVLAADSDLANYAETDGSDIAFYAADQKTVLAHTINTFNEATGAIDATVTVPVVSGAKDTIIYMMFGE